MSDMDSLINEQYEITQQMMDILDVTWDDDAEGNPVLLTQEQNARLRELGRKSRDLEKQIRQLEN